jgi:ketosteroid isomerase-like protein
MNLRPLLPILLVTGLSPLGAQEKPAPLLSLSEPQKAVISREVGQLASTWLQAHERSDVRAILACYATHPDFPLMYADSEGRLGDFEVLQRSVHEDLEGSGQVTINLRKEMITVLDADTALWSFQGAWRGGRGGTALQPECCTVSLVIKRLAGEWKIVYQHESGLDRTDAKSVEARSKGK